jgi:hypothetical protein
VEGEFVPIMRAIVSSAEDGSSFMDTIHGADDRLPVEALEFGTRAITHCSRVTAADLSPERGYARPWMEGACETA